MTSAENITSLPKRPLKARAKDSIERNKTRIALAGAGLFALVSSYHIGKSRGQTNFTIDFYNGQTPPPGEDRKLLKRFEGSDKDL